MAISAANVKHLRVVIKCHHCSEAINIGEGAVRMGPYTYHPRCYTDRLHKVMEDYRYTLDRLGLDAFKPQEVSK